MKVYKIVGPNFQSSVCPLSFIKSPPKETVRYKKENTFKDNREKYSIFKNRYL